jgi:tetratricopeptide (TPR) repeat protein
MRADIAHIRTWSSQARRWYRHALELRARGRFDVAADLLARTLVLQPSSALLREQVAVTQFRAGHLIGARTTFTAMVAVDPRDEYALYGLGVVEAKLGRLGVAEVDLATAAEVRPHTAAYEDALDRVRRALAEGYPPRPPGLVRQPDGQLRPVVPALPEAVRDLALAPRPVAGGTDV